ncbi:MAG: hypothetical protein GC190_21080 [Alphaproteobacteria bacterium]|nr:hypothetical protein [Alphaproteobacteria bacterium]
MSATNESASAGTSSIGEVQPQQLPSSVMARAMAPEWTQNLPPDLRSMVETKGYKTPADLAQAYAHAERAIGADKVVVPKDGVWDQQARAKLGIPERADGYHISRPSMPAGVAYDENFERSMLPVAHKLGLTPSQVQGLVDAVTSHRLGEYQSQSMAFHGREAETVAMLKAEYGQGYDAKIQQASRAVRHFGGDEVIQILNESGYGNHPALIRMMAKIGGMMTEDSLKVGRGAGAGLTADEAQVEYKKLMASEAYRRGDHPEHADVVRKVQQLFEQSFRD